ncbi:hypothetical protein [Dactylosporangium sp. CA-139066]|uniref:hypothetical protein n=1 Tax=Dactylosporangium sp. CA-139066 TaxID=3239930 RepID=UPI003D8AA1E9
MGTTQAVMNADNRLLTLTGELGQLQRRIGDELVAGPGARNTDQLLADADNLLADVQQELITIDPSLGPRYRDEFHAVTNAVQHVRDEILKIPLFHVKQDLRTLLGPGWQAAAPAGFAWFRGTPLPNALEVLQAGHFNARKTNHGAYFGLGTYFAPGLATALTYGPKCVFGLNPHPNRVLRVLEAGYPVFASAFGGAFVVNDVIYSVQLEIVLDYEEKRRIRDSGNAASAVAEIARSRQYDAVEVLASREGHLLILLDKHNVAPANVVYLDLM